MYKLVFENLFLKDGIRRKDNVINIFLDNYSNRVLNFSSYIASKNTHVGTQTYSLTKHNIQTFTAGNNYRIIIARGKEENVKNHKKLNINLSLI